MLKRLLMLRFIQLNLLLLITDRIILIKGCNA